MGNYTGSRATTGSNLDYQHRHIYDMAGNVAEWTMEAYSTSYRVSRGCISEGDGNKAPASVRAGRTANNEGTLFGFRLALYIQ